MKIIARRNYKNFILGGGNLMDYSFNNQISDDAKKEIEKSILQTKINVAKKKIYALNIDLTEQIYEKVCFDDVESKTIKSKLDEIDTSLMRLSDKRVAIDTFKDDALSRLDLMVAKKYVDQLKDIDVLIKSLDDEKSELESKISASHEEYDLKMSQLKAEAETNGGGFDETKYPKAIINDYKKFVAKQVVSDFMQDLTDNQKDFVLKESKEIERYYDNVGENI